MSPHSNLPQISFQRVYRQTPKHSNPNAKEFQIKRKDVFQSYFSSRIPIKLAFSGKPACKQPNTIYRIHKVLQFHTPDTPSRRLMTRILFLKYTLKNRIRKFRKAAKHYTNQQKETNQIQSVTLKDSRLPLQNQKMHEKVCSFHKKSRPLYK